MAVAGLVSRVSATPPTVTDNVALPVTVPVLGDVNVTEQVPLVVPVEAHVLVTMLNAEPPELVNVTVGLVPFGTLTKPAPSPAFCLAVTVNVWFWPTSFTASGLIATVASTKVLVAGPLPPGPDGMVAVADGTREADEKLERVLTCDPGLGVVRHADAGYPEAIAAAARDNIDVPMRTPRGVVR